MAKIKELDLFKPVKEFLEDRGFEVFSEVDPQYYNTGRADVVGLDRPFVTVVELKTCMNLDVIAQAERWKGYAHYVYIAIPKPKRPLNRYAVKLLKREGIGIITIDFIELNERNKQLLGYKDDENFCGCAQLYQRPGFNRKALVDWINVLDEHFKKGPGGQPGGGYSTKYKRMLEQVYDIMSGLRNKNWMEIPEILEHCNTYYAHPKQSLYHALLRENEMFEYKKENGKHFFRVKKLSNFKY